MPRGVNSLLATVVLWALGLPSVPLYAQEPREPSDLLQTQGTAPGGKDTRGREPRIDQEVDITIATELPGLLRLTRRESEGDWRERLRRESLTKPGTIRIFFPEYHPISKESFTPRDFPPMVEVVEPLVMQHRRLFFEQLNLERQGWDLGILTPAANLGKFYYDVALLPYHYWSRPCDHCDSSAGKCLPGDPTPLYLYRERFSLTGLAGQAATVVGGMFIFP